MKNRKFPSAQSILIVIAAFVAVLTWIYQPNGFNPSDIRHRVNWI